MATMRLRFWKLVGAGNDFIGLNNIAGELEKIDRAALARQLCQQHFSIGADGLFIIEPSETCHFAMRHFNPDGSESETCGNGARCIARLAHYLNIAPAKMYFETRAGKYEAEILDDTNVIIKISDPKDIQLDLGLDLSIGQRKVDFINTGVPHVVLEVEDLDNIDVNELGREIRYHARFQPQGANVNFINILDDENLRIRTYERHVEGETLACGTGTVAAGIITGLKAQTRPPVNVQTRGGPVLRVHFEKKENKPTNIRLEGEARLVFSGELII